jgi:thiosulfate/3-mercaptopyruvate sulfurtransferase
VSSEVLVQPDELAALLESAAPPVLADVRWTLAGGPAEAEFLAAHLPGAQWVDLERDLSAPPGPGGRHPRPSSETLTATLRRIGVQAERPVVAYDGASSLADARLWWLLTDAGHPEVRVLDGGLAAWQAAGGPTESGPATPVLPGTFLARPGRRRTVTAGAIATGLAAGTGPRLVDVRAAERFSGATEPIDLVAGHIPGAVNLPATSLQGPDGRFLPAAVLQRRFAEAGVDADTVLYCGSGITAAQSLLALESAGGSAALYPGSWSDWIRDPAHPVATGSA